MRPFSTSANAQTASSVAVVSMKVNSRKIMRYARMAVMLWNKYWKHFSPEYAQPKIVEDAKNNRPIVIKYGPISPSNTPNAEAVSTPASIDPSCHRPDITIVIPVIEQMINVSKRTCVMDTNACRPGTSVLAAAAAIGAEPSPASLENNPRATPNLIAAPMAPPPTASPEKAAEKIVANASGT